MTFREVLDQKIKHVRLPQWAAGAYLAPYYTADGFVGPWVTLHDPCAGTPDQQLPVFDLTNDAETRYEPVEGETEMKMPQRKGDGRT